jgi:OOP family OmpA-OmpF porin
MAGLISSRSDLGVIAIEGHTDSRGADAFNLELSKRRAKTVRAFLIVQGVSEGRLTADGFGESRPIASNDTQEGRNQNRRVEFRLTGTSSLPNNVSGEGQ